MSKSSKKRPYLNKANETAPITGKPIQGSASQPTPEIKETNYLPASFFSKQRFQPIRFDKRVKWFVGICFALFCLMTLGKLHLMSIPMWNQLLPDGSDPRRGLIAGQPLQIRMDDYAGGAPFILSQYNNGLPLVNRAIGGEKTPLAFGLPTKHFTAFFKPQLWGYFFLDVERGYAFNFNMTVLLGLLSAAFIFLLLTNNNFWLSIFGSIWITLSSGTVWWVYGPLTTFWGAFAIFVVGVYLFFETKLSRLILLSLLLAYLLCSHALLLYPTWQVPLGYFIVLLFIGYLIKVFDWNLIKVNLSYKLLGIVLSVAVVGVLGYLYFSDAKDTLNVMSNTVYPGKRSELGGTGFIANYFSEYFSWFVGATKLPQQWLNICEVSHYITFAPFILFSVLIYYFYNKQVDSTLLFTSVFIILGLIWIEIGYPAVIAKLTLMSTSPTRRTQIPFGVANVFYTILFMNFIKDRTQAKGISWIYSLAFIIVLMILVALNHLDTSQGFIKAHQLFVPVVFFIILHSLLIYNLPIKYKLTLFSVGILLFLLPNLKAHPLAKGLSPITEHKLYQAIQEIKATDPTAAWVVNGSQFVSYMVTATGVNTLSGIKIIPDYKTMKVLDPLGKRDSIYNRFAHTVYSSYIDGTGNDTTVLVNNFEDAYSVGIDPCSPKLKKLNVKYMIFDKQPQPVEVRCMDLLTKVGTLQIYKRRD